MTPTKAAQATKKTAEEPRKPGEGFPSDPGYVPTLSEETTDKYMELVTSPELVDPRAVQLSIVQRIMEADDFDAALDMGDASSMSARDLLDEPFQIVSPPTWLRSASQYAENSSGVFVVLQCRLGDGTQRVVTCGGENVLAQTYKGVTTGAIPSNERWFRFRSVGTSSGYDVLWLARGDAPTT